MTHRAVIESNGESSDDTEWSMRIKPDQQSGNYASKNISRALSRLRKICIPAIYGDQPGQKTALVDSRCISEDHPSIGSPKVAFVVATLHAGFHSA